MPLPSPERDKNAAKFPPTKTIAEQILTNAQDIERARTITKRFLLVTWN